jgi:flagellar hook-associated protein 2
VVQASAEEGAPPGGYAVQAEQLASEQRIATPSGAFEDSSDKIGTGRMVITDAQSKEQVVQIEDEQATLLGIRDAINEQTEGFRASVVDDGSGPRLAISSKETGQENSIEQISVEQDKEDQGDLSALQYRASADRERQVEGQQTTGGFEQVQAAADAVVTIDGMQVSRPTNTIEGAVEGVTLELQAEGGSRVSVSEKTGLVEQNIQRLVDSYNRVQGQLNKLSEYDPETEKAAPLQGDSTLTNISARLSRALTEPVDYLAGQSVRALGDLGVFTNRDGQLEVKGARLQKMAGQYPEQVTELMTRQENGVMARIEGVLAEVLGRDGVISTRTDGLEGRLERIDEERNQLDRRMENREEQLRSKFSDMNQRVAEMNKTSDFLQQRLAGTKGKD